MKFERTEIKHDLSKRFWVFSFYQYYPGGGLCDLVGTFDLYEEALGVCDKCRDFHQILDTQKGFYQESL